MANNLLSILESYKESGWLRSQIHPTLPITIWNYTQKTQFEGFWDIVTILCRGLVVDGEGNIVARPFKKFFNIEENKHKPTNEFDVYEKMDGSLGIYFNYKGQWILATRGSFTSDQALKGIEILKKYNTSHFDPNNTYLFEIIYPENRIVVDYGNEEKMVLLGEIANITGFEYPIEKHTKYGIDVVKKYNGISDYSALKHQVNHNAEGFIIRFKNGDRCKIKGEEYIRLHRIMTEISTTSVWESLLNKDMLEEILENVPDEFYNKIKEYRDQLQESFTFLKNFIYKRYKEIEKELGPCDDKNFALKVKDNKFSSFFFSLRKGKEIDNMIWKKLKPEYRKL